MHRVRSPAILIAKLALDRRLHGESLVVALTTIVSAARRAGGKFVVVDAVDEAAARFYEHYEFTAVPANPGRLARKLSTIAASSTWIGRSATRVRLDDDPPVGMVGEAPRARRDLRSRRASALRWLCVEVRSAYTRR